MTLETIIEQCKNDVKNAHRVYRTISPSVPTTANIQRTVNRGWNYYISVLNHNFKNYLENPNNSAYRAQFVKALQDAAVYQKGKKTSNPKRVALLQEYANQIDDPRNDSLLTNNPSFLGVIGKAVGKVVDKGIATVVPDRDRLFIEELKNAPEYKRFIEYYQNRYASDAPKKQAYSFFDSGDEKSKVLEDLFKSLKNAKTQNQVHECLENYFSNEPKQAHAQETLSRPQGINLNSILCWLGLKSTKSHNLMEHLYIKAAEVGQKYAANPTHSHMNDYLFCSEFGAIKAYVDNQDPLNNAKVSVLKRFLSNANKSDGYLSLNNLVNSCLNNEQLKEHRSSFHNPLSSPKSIQLLEQFKQAIDDIHAQKSNLHKFK